MFLFLRLLRASGFFFKKKHHINPNIGSYAGNSAE